jgi:hypothetical protein
MTFNKEGITTGLMGYSLKKEFFSDAIPFREVESFTYEIYSTDVTGLSSTTIQSSIYNQFISQYSGDIQVKVFNAPAEYQFPNDSIRSAKFNVQVDIRRNPSFITGYTELTGAYYNGLDSGFFNQYSTALVDFKEDFNFEKSDNGHQSLFHSVSFGLMSGGRNLATQIVSGIFATDYTTPYGISVMISGMTGANPATVQNYYTESYDLIKNDYSFSRKRDFLPYDASAFNYNLNHTMQLNDAGIFDITEKCDLQGKISFLQAKQGLDLVFAGSWDRCNNFYSTFNAYIAQPGLPTSIYSVSTLPRKVNKTYNQPNLTSSYDVTYTNDPQFNNNGYSQEEIINFNINQKNIITIGDKYTFTINKRTPTSQMAYPLLVGAFASSPPNMSGYYSSNAYYDATKPIILTKYEMNWPYNKNISSIEMNYSNDPRNNVIINGLLFKTFDIHVENNQPVDIIEEYKIINRPNKLSVLNYAYQTEKGDVSININAGIGRQTNEFINGFRNDLASYLSALYFYSIDIFVQQFVGIYPVSFTYYLSDIKYSFNNDGMINMTVQFTYTIKKYLM